MPAQPVDDAPLVIHRLTATLAPREWSACGPLPWLEESHREPDRFLVRLFRAHAACLTELAKSDPPRRIALYHDAVEVHARGDAVVPSTVASVTRAPSGTVSIDTSDFIRLCD